MEGHPMKITVHEDHQGINRHWILWSKTSRDLPNRSREILAHNSEWINSQSTPKMNCNLMNESNSFNHNTCTDRLPLSPVLSSDYLTARDSEFTLAILTPTIIHALSSLLTTEAVGSILARWLTLIMVSNRTSLYHCLSLVTPISSLASQPGCR